MKFIEIKEDNLFKVTLEDGVGYCIRPKNFRGSVFTVTYDLRLSIGQSSRVHYPRELWLALQKEIETGFSYMLELQFRGSQPIQSVKKISASKLKPYTLYRRPNDFFIYIGDGVITEHGWHDINRSGCYICYATGTDLNQINVTPNGIYLGNTWSIDTRSTKPSNCLEVINEFPRGLTTWFKNGHPFYFKSKV